MTDHKKAQRYRARLVCGIVVDIAVTIFAIYFLLRLA